MQIHEFAAMRRNGCVIFWGFNPGPTTNVSIGYLSHKSGHQPSYEQLLSPMSLEVGSNGLYDHNSSNPALPHKDPFQVVACRGVGCGLYAYMRALDHLWGFKVCFRVYSLMTGFWKL